MLADKVAELLIDVEASLRQMNLWSDESPSPEAMASTEPFAIDTMGFEQWLQFIFLPIMYQLIESGQPFPPECSIAPMAEEYFRGSDMPSRSLQRALVEIDRLLTS